MIWKEYQWLTALNQSVRGDPNFYSRSHNFWSDSPISKKNIGIESLYSRLLFVHIQKKNFPLNFLSYLKNRIFAFIFKNFLAPHQSFAFAHLRHHGLHMPCTKTWCPKTSLQPFFALFDFHLEDRMSEKEDRFTNKEKKHHLEAVAKIYLVRIAAKKKRNESTHGVLTALIDEYQRLGFSFVSWQSVSYPVKKLTKQKRKRRSV